MVGTGIGNLEELRNWEADTDEETRKLVPDFFATKLDELLPHINRFI